MNKQKTKKEVQLSYRKPYKRKLYLLLIDSIRKTGKLPKIEPKQKRQYYLNILKGQAIIEKFGYGTWKVNEEIWKQNKYNFQKIKPYGLPQKAPPKVVLVRDIRGHGFVTKLKIPKIRNWEKRSEYLKKKNIKDHGKQSKINVIFIDGWQFWLCSKSIILYAPKELDLLTSSAEESYLFYMYKIRQMFKKLESMLNFKFSNLKGYNIEISKQHYGKIHDDLAKLCNKTKDKLFVYDEYGELWLMVDNSLNLNEAETQGLKAVERMDNVFKPFVNDIRSYYEGTGELPLMSDVIKIQVGIQKNQVVFDSNMASHISAVKELGSSVKEFNKEIKSFSTLIAKALAKK